MRLRSIFLILVVCALFVAVDAGAQMGAARGKGRIKGTVTDAEGKPIEGATVHFSSEKLNTSFDLKTDKNGNFGAIGIAGTTWNVDFSKEGYETKLIFAPVAELGFNKPIEVQLQPAVKKPVPAAKVPGLSLIEEGNTLKANKDYQGALGKYNEALQLNPQLFKVYADIGNIYIDLEQPDKAIESYQHFLEKEPDNQDVHILILGALLKKGNMDEAKKQFASLSLDGVKDIDRLYNLGASFYNAKQTPEAIRCWEKTVAADPQNADAYLQLGLANYSIQQMDKAKANLQKVIELAPDSENAKSAKELLDSMK